MSIKTNFSKPYILLFPFVGMVIFIILYTLSAINYPGGSWRFMDHTKFSLWHNYLCDLLDDYAINGAVNNARFFARAALGVLCTSLILIWFNLPKLFVLKSLNRTIMKWSGMLSLFITVFLASGTHDFIVRVAGIFGIVAVTTCLFELYKSNYYKALTLGVFCLVIFVGNYFVYETGFFIEILPILQKITFISFIVWFVFLDMLLYRKQKL